MGHQGENTVTANSFPGCVGAHHEYQHNYNHQKHAQHQHNDKHGQLDGLLVNLRRVRRNVVIGDTGNEIPAGPRDGRIHKLIAGIPKVNLGAAAFIVPEIREHPLIFRAALGVRCKEFLIHGIFFKICKQIQGLSQFPVHMGAGENQT